MNQTTIGSHIAQKRRAQNLTQEQLAEQLRCVEQDHLQVGDPGVHLDKDTTPFPR